MSRQYIIHSKYYISCFIAFGNKFLPKLGSVNSVHAEVKPTDWTQNNCALAWILRSRILELVFITRLRKSALSFCPVYIVILSERFDYLGCFQTNQSKTRARNVPGRSVEKTRLETVDASQILFILRKLVMNGKQWCRDSLQTSLPQVWNSTPIKFQAT